MQWLADENLVLLNTILHFLKHQNEVNVSDDVFFILQVDLMTYSTVGKLYHNNH